VSSRIQAHIRSNVIGYIALFLVLTGGTAYALDGSNTVFSDDIVDGEVKSVDLQDLGVANADLAGNSVGSNKINNGGVANADLGADSVSSAKVTDGSLTGGDVADNTLGTSDIDDSLTADDLQDAGIFASSDEDRNDVVGGGSTDATMLDNPNGFPYDVIGHCTENPAGTVLATVTVQTQGFTNPITWAVDSTAQGGVNDNVAVPDGAQRTLASLGPTTGAHWATGSYSVTGTTSPGRIRNMSGTVSVGTKVSTSGFDCKFNVTALG
jgi:hypothetical protein